MPATSIRLAALWVADAGALLVLRHEPAAVLASHDLVGRLSSDPDATLVTVCGALVWLAAAWIAVGLLASLGARLPGTAGSVCAACGRILLPRVLAGVVAGSAGLGVLLTPVVASAQQSPVPGPAWPVSSVPSIAPPTWPGGSSTTAAPAQPPAAQPSVQRAPIPANRPSEVRTAKVRPGDSLWLLAAHRLGPQSSDTQIAHYWPRMYAVNRTVIGDDPAHLSPGQELALPAPTTQETP